MSVQDDDEKTRRDIHKSSPRLAERKEPVFRRAGGFEFCLRMVWSSCMRFPCLCVFVCDSVSGEGDPTQSPIGPG